MLPALLERSEGRCELCSAGGDLAAHHVAPHADGLAEHVVVACAACRAQLADPDKIEPDHWRCLADSMWTPVPAVQVTAFRMLDHLRRHTWAQALLDQLVLDDETQAWADEQPAARGDDDPARPHVDAHGAVLADGDTVTLIKDLEVKGAGFTAKRGTAVRGISLVPDVPEQVEGRVNGTRIVLLTKYLKKS
jgi:protein PhnA